MTVGLAATGYANAALNVLRGTTFTGVTTWVKLHTADPGAAGATAASAVTTRQTATFSAASAGSMALSNTPSWSMTATETISHISLWDASTAGTFLASVTLTTPRAVVNTDTLNLTSLTLSFTPIAA